MSLVRWLLGSLDASATNLNLKDSFSTTDCSTKAFERRIADIGQMNSAAITRNPVELKRRILMVSLKISNALRELKRCSMFELLESLLENRRWLSIPLSPMLFCIPDSSSNEELGRCKASSSMVSSQRAIAR